MFAKGLISKNTQRRYKTQERTKVVPLKNQQKGQMDIVVKICK